MYFLYSSLVHPLESAAGFSEWNLGGGKAVPFYRISGKGNRLGAKGSAGDYYGIQYFSVPSYPCSGFGTENRAAKSDIRPARSGGCGRQRDRTDFGECSGNQRRDWGISFAGAYGDSVSASFKNCPDCGGSKGNGSFYGDCQRQAADGMREQNRRHGDAVTSDGGDGNAFVFCFHCHSNGIRKQIEEGEWHSSFFRLSAGWGFLWFVPGC